jgi:proteic killer suppression protein
MNPESRHDRPDPTAQIHLKGQYKGYWAVDVSGNWRVVFRFEAGHATDIGFVDYH